MPLLHRAGVPVQSLPSSQQKLSAPKAGRFFRTTGVPVLVNALGSDQAALVDCRAPMPGFSVQADGMPELRFPCALPDSCTAEALDVV